MLGAADKLLRKRQSLLSKLDHLVATATKASVGDSSHAGQRVAMRIWIKFCILVCDVSPVRGKSKSGGAQSHEERMTDEWLLMRFATACSMQTCVGTAATYVSHVKSWHQIHHRVTLGPEAGCVGLARVINGLRKLSKHRPRGQKLPISLDHLRQWDPILRHGSPDDRVFMAAAYSAFGGLLRASEYTSATPTFDPQADLSRADIVFHPSIENPEYCLLRLRPTKTDPKFECRTPLMLPMDASCLTCACRALRDMILADPVPLSTQASTPLFRWHSCKEPVTYTQMLNSTHSLMRRIGCPSNQYGTHSFRIGGATALADADCPDVIIQSLGRWRSACYRMYCRSSQGSVLRWGRVLMTHVAVPVAAHRN